MTKKALEFIDKEISSRAGQIQFCGRAGYHREDLEAQIDILIEIRSLIESSGKRTVSRDSALAWWEGIHKVGIKSGGNQFLRYLRSLGISIDEPKGGGGGER